MEYCYTPPLLRVILPESITKKRYELFTLFTQKTTQLNTLNRRSKTHPD